MLAWKMSQETSHTKLSVQKVVKQLCTKLGSSCLKPTCSNAQSKLAPFPLNRLEATRNIVCIKLQLWKPSTRHRLSPWIGDLAGEGSLGSLIVDRYDDDMTIVENRSVYSMKHGLIFKLCFLQFYILRCTIPVMWFIYKQFLRGYFIHSMAANSYVTLYW